MHCIASAEADLIKFQYIIYKIPSSSDSKPLLALPYFPNHNLKFCSSKGHITDWQVDNSKATSLSPALQLRAIHTPINKGKNNLKLQLTRKTNKFKKKLKNYQPFVGAEINPHPRADLCTSNEGN